MNGRLENNLKMEKKIERRLSSLPDYVTEWDINLKASQLTASSRVTFVYRIGNFLTFISKNPKEIKVEDITQLDVQNYFVSLQTRTVNGELKETSDALKCAAWTCMHNFFAYMIKRKYISEDPLSVIPRPKNNDLDRINEHRILLTAENFKAMLTEIDNDFGTWWYTRSRNKLMLLLFMTTGMRKTALSEINVDDIDVDNKVLYVIDKNKKRHIYDLAPEVLDYYKAWMFDRQKFLKKLEKESNALFINREGNRMAVWTIEEVVARYSEKVLGYKVSPHKLRAGYVSILYNQTHDIEYVRKCVGHSDVSTTQRYIVTKGEERKSAAEMISNLLS